MGDKQANMVFSGCVSYDVAAAGAQREVGEKCQKKENVEIVAPFACTKF